MFAEIRCALGEKAIRQGFTEKLFDRLLEKAPRRPDGTWQVIASLKIEGDPVGGFKWHGTRPDDPNDVIPHENRRELRGGRLFCAWLNHTDVNTKNTLDVFVGKKDSGYVKHYLIDFGTTLGSGAFEPHRARLGSEYAVDWADTAKSMITLGLWEREWQKIEFPDYPTIGNFEARHFHPELWKPDQLNPAFLRMRLGDAFWAASILSQFSDRVVSRVVKEGRLSDAQAEAYLIRTLLDRRDKILSYYLSLMNPIDRFQVQQSAARSELHFANIGAETGVGQADSYEYTWYSYDNSSDRLKRLDGPRRVGLESIPIPRITDHALPGGAVSDVQPGEAGLGKTRSRLPQTRGIRVSSHRDRARRAEHPAGSRAAQAAGRTAERGDSRNGVASSSRVCL